MIEMINNVGIDKEIMDRLQEAECNPGVSS